MSSVYCLNLTVSGIILLVDVGVFVMEVTACCDFRLPKYIKYCHYHLWYDSLLWAIVFLGFPKNRIFTVWGCQPNAEPLTWRTRPPYL
jgi:hypothetical protein